MKFSKILDLAFIGAMKQLDWRKEVLATKTDSKAYQHMVEVSEQDVADLKCLIFKIKAGVLHDDEY